MSHGSGFEVTKLPSSKDLELSQEYISLDRQLAHPVEVRTAQCRVAPQASLIECWNQCLGNSSILEGELYQ